VRACLVLAECPDVWYDEHIHTIRRHFVIKLRELLRHSRLFALLAILLLGAACEGGTSGSVTGARQRCSSTIRAGQCSGSFKTLSGTYSLDVENDSVVSSAEVEVSAAAERGPLKVYFETPDGETRSVEVPAGGSATLRDTVKGEWDGFRVYFEAVEGSAEGVTYELSYQVP
jgi:hypothetical protein